MNKERLELKHVAPYLPYEVRVEVLNYQCDYVGHKYEVLSGYYIAGDVPQFYMNKDRAQAGKDVSLFKLILRPLSDLTNKIKYDGEVFIPYWRIAEKHLQLTGMEMPKHTFEQLESPKGYDYLPHWIFQDLIKWHFDLFWLIPSGLAIDINTLQNTLK